jgi:hypothetical protein
MDQRYKAMLVSPWMRVKIPMNHEADLALLTNSLLIRWWVADLEGNC